MEKVENFCPRLGWDFSAETPQFQLVLLEPCLGLFARSAERGPPASLPGREAGRQAWELGLVSSPALSRCVTLVPCLMILFLCSSPLNMKLIAAHVFWC